MLIPDKRFRLNRKLTHDQEKAHVPARLRGMIESGWLSEDKAVTSIAYQERIIRDKGICGGQPVFKGTRVTLRTVLASLAEGDSAESILANFPTLKPEDIRAAIAFAAASAEEDLPVSAAPDFR